MPITGRIRVERSTFTPKEKTIKLLQLGRILQFKNEAAKTFAEVFGINTAEITEITRLRTNPLSKVLSREARGFHAKSVTRCSHIQSLSSNRP
jgi:hypothetical protein